MNLKDIIENGKLDLEQRLLNKNTEYANEEEVFKNFDEAINIMIFQNPSRQAVAWNYLVKHLISLKNIIETNENKNLIHEKCGDIRAYVTLIENMY